MPATCLVSSAAAKAILRRLWVESPRHLALRLPNCTNERKQLPRWLRQRPLPETRISELLAHSLQGMLLFHQNTENSLMNS